jgi:predicted component of type VI protein secretion system
MEVSLKALNGPAVGETIRVLRGKLLIGREEDCQLRPQSGFVSRHHCVLLLDEFTLRIRDLGSQNGTFINGRRIAKGPAILLNGDVISIGDLDFQIAVLDGAGVAGPGDGSESALATTALCDDQTVDEKVPGAVPHDPGQPPIEAQIPATPEPSVANPLNVALRPSAPADDTSLLPPPSP